MTQDTSQNTCGRCPTARQLPTVPYLVIGIVWFCMLPVPYVVGRLFPEFGIPKWWHFSSGVLALAGWMTWCFLRRGASARFALLIAVGMSLGFVADVNGVSSWFDWGFDRLLITIPLFSLGHVAYIAACFEASQRFGLRGGRRWKPAVLWSLAVWFLVGLIVWWWIVWNGQAKTNLRWPTLPYVMLLSTTTALMCALAVLDRAFTLMAVGALLFLISDALLAAGIFQKNWQLGHWCWIVYGPGQMLIVFGAAYAAARQSITATPIETDSLNAVPTSRF